MTHARLSSEAPSTWRDAAVIALLALVVSVNTLGNAIVYDDRVLIENPVLREAWSWPGAFGSTWWGEAQPSSAIYRPIASWTLALNGWANTLAGAAFESVGSYHVVNALIHAGASVLVLAFLRVIGLGLAPARIGAAMFAVLGIHVEAIAPITGRSETLALLFGLAFVLLHARRANAVLASALFAASIACKESAVGFLVVALAVDVIVKRERPSVPRFVAAIAALGVFLAARWAVLRGNQGAIAMLDNPLVAVGWGERVLTALAVQFEYVWLMLVPVGFQSDASHAELEIARSLLDPRLGGCVVVLCVLAIWLRWGRRDRRVLGVALLGYAALFAVTSNVLFAIGTARAERLAYAPSVFVCALLGLGCARIGPRVGTALAVALVAVNLTASLARNTVWRDPGTFFRAQVLEAPDSAKARFSLGAQLAAENDDAGAEREYARALEIHPEYVEVLFNLGNVLRRRGESEHALGHYRRALELQPRFLPAAFGTVGALVELGRVDEARSMLEQIERRAPGHAWIEAHRAMLERRR